MFTKQFGLALLERALKTFAQTFVATAVESGAVGVLDLTWVGCLSAAGLAALLSVLTSVGTAKLGKNSGPSVGPEKIDE